jgi:hypothetical protein
MTQHKFAVYLPLRQPGSPRQSNRIGASDERELEETYTHKYATSSARTNWHVSISYARPIAFACVLINPNVVKIKV